MKQPIWKPVPPEEQELRRQVKRDILARYGVASWDDAPDEALRDYLRFLRTRTIPHVAIAQYAGEET